MEDFEIQTTFNEDKNMNEELTEELTEGGDTDVQDTEDTSE